MAFRLRPDESLADGLARIAAEQIERAIADLDPAASDRVEGVHAARKRMKKVRALLRLVRDEIDDDIYCAENAALRDVARGLAVVRDAGAMTETVEKLRGMVGGGPERALLERTGALLAARSGEGMSSAEELERIVAPLRERLSVARRHVRKWRVERKDFRAIRGGLLATYRAGREGFSSAVEEPSAEALHEWRKSVKYLWYQIRILRPLWPEMLRGMSRELRGLAETLGEDHDLTELRALIASEPELAADGAGREALAGAIDRRRRELQQSAFSAAARIYSERPKAFAERFGKYWKAWAASSRD